MGDSQSNTRTDLQTEEAAPASVDGMVHGEAAGNGLHPPVQQFALQPSSSLDEAGRLQSTEDMHLDPVDSGTEHELMSRSSIDVDELVRRTSAQLSGADFPTVRCAACSPSAAVQEQELSRCLLAERAAECSDRGAQWRGALVSAHASVVTAQGVCRL